MVTGVYFADTLKVPFTTIFYKGDFIYSSGKSETYIYLKTYTGNSVYCTLGWYISFSSSTGIISSMSLEARTQNNTLTRPSNTGTYTSPGWFKVFVS